MNASSKDILQAGNWEPENRLALEKLILTYGKSSSDYDPSNQPVAVFDWDHTCIAGDIGNSNFYYLVDNLLVNFNSDYFSNLIPERFYRDEIISCYRRISKLPLEDAKLTDEYKRYRALLIKASDQIAKEDGIVAVCTWAVKLLKGLTISEVRKAAAKAFEQALKSPFERVEVKLFDDDLQPVKIFVGIRLYQEMKDLIAQLQIHGFEVWVVSATCKWVVETLAIKYGVLPDRVIGITPSTSDEGIVLERILSPIPVEAGKVEAIDHFIKKRPLLVAGDTIHDLPMLKHSSYLRLVVERSGEERLKEYASQNGWLIQPGFIR